MRNRPHALNASLLAATAFAMQVSSNAAQAGDDLLALKLATQLTLLQATATGSVGEVAAAAMPTRRRGVAELGAAALLYLPALLGAQAGVRASAERSEQARGVLRPSLTASAGQRREFADSGTTRPFRSTSAGLQASVPLYRPQADAGVDQAVFQEQASQHAFSEARRDTLSLLAQTYVNCALLDEFADLQKLQRELLLQQQAINERRVQGGVGTRVEVMETAARADALLAQWQSTQSQYRAQLIDLERLSGMPVDALRRMRPGEPATLVPATIAAAMGDARQRNATLARLESALQAAQANVQVQRYAEYPTVLLTGNLDRSQFSAAGSSSNIPSNALGVQLALPLATGGITQARIREAMELENKARADLQDATNIIEADLRKTYLDLELARQLWQTQQRALDIATAASEATRKAFDAGARSNIDLLNSQQAIFSARQSLAAARAEALLAQTRILASIEGLSVAALERMEAAFGD